MSHSAVLVIEHRRLHRWVLRLCDVIGAALHSLLLTSHRWMIKCECVSSINNLPRDSGCFAITRTLYYDRTKKYEIRRTQVAIRASQASS